MSIIPKFSEDWKNSHPSTWIAPEEARKAIHEGTGRGIKVAVIDSGIELSHPWLRHLRLVDDIAFERSEAGVATRSAGHGVDQHGHGTAVAYALHRIAPEAQIGSFRVLDKNLASRWRIIREACLLAIDRGYHVLSCSFGSPASVTSIDFFKPWIDVAYRRGVHVVSACNNDYFRKAEWPGNFPTVITVNMGRIETDDLLFRWDLEPGNVSRHLVEFAARGVEVDLPWKGGRVKKETGSSFAAPHVAGLLARLLSRHPGLKPPVAKALLQEVAVPWEPAHRGPNS